MTSDDRQDLLFHYWAKTGARAPGGEPSTSYHPLGCHCLDVAACGRALLEANPLLEHRLAAASGLSKDDLRGWATFLLAVHDLGKIADGFQALAPEWMEKLQGRRDDPGYPFRHDTLGYWLWNEELGLFEHPAVREALFPPGLGTRDRRQLLDTWLFAAAGHHGRPPLLGGPDSTLFFLRRQFPEAVLADARRFVLWAAGRFVPEGFPLAGTPEDDDALDEQLERLERSSWLFAGLAVAADWIGSNTAWFPYETEPRGPEAYWEEVARPRSAAAVAESGLAASAPRSETGLGTLFPAFRPTPLQRLVEELPLAPGPQIFVIEEATGGGKTEAALVLAQRLIAAGQAQGVYLALPTMATANAMFDRVGTIHRELFGPAAGSPPPSLILAHSKRHLRLPLQDTAADRSYDGRSPAAPEAELTASLASTAWLADGRKRALLADVGVGTIDQALLAVLPVRHQSLRLWGLAGKVLVADEVHACDRYVQTLLERLLSFHAAAGGSAVLLSATLPHRMRQSLLAAFASGLRLTAPALEETRYPLLTHAAPGLLREEPLAAREEVCRRLEVAFVHAEEAAEETLLAALDAGRCACWLRNTVGDARRAFERLAPRLGERVRLFHSRFTVGDRSRIEADVLARFGKAGGPGERRGQLLVATQVVEQSLDLDFDVLVTDLCPIDLVIQRAGRLRRHRRSRDGAVVEGPDERGPAVLHVLSPPLAGEPEALWFRELFPGGAFVYPDHGRLWLTAQVLARKGGFRIPEDAREVLEAVYGPESEAAIPEALLEESWKAEGESQAAKALAWNAALSLESGYRPSSSDWPEDVYTPTRLGEPTVVLRLARREDGRIVPFETEGDHRWERSELSVRQREVGEEDPAEAEALEALREQMGAAARWVRFVVLEEGEGGWVGQALDGKGRGVRCRYARTSGFHAAP